MFQIMVTAGCLKDAQEAVKLVKDHGKLCFMESCLARLLLEKQHAPKY